MPGRRWGGGARFGLALAVALAVSPAAAQAAFPVGENGRLALDTGRVAYFMNLDGTVLGVTALTLGGYQSGASFSPSGRFLAIGHAPYSDSPPPPIGDVFTMRVDGSKALAVTRSPTRSEVDPRFSPNGKRIMFTRQPGYPSDDSEVLIVNADGSNQTVIAIRDGFDNRGTDFSPDGKRILLTLDSDPGEAANLDVFVANADGSGLMNLTSGSPESDQEAHFSPDGRRIVFTRWVCECDYPTATLESNVMVMDADGSDQSAPLQIGIPGDSNPLFSPDGRQIAFQRTNGPDAGRIFVADAKRPDVAPVPTGAEGAAAGGLSDWEAIYRCGGRRARVVGSDADDILKGTRKADAIVGNGGDDRILGAAGNDRICGGRGDDVLLGGPGKSDRLHGGRGQDKLQQ